ncbi:MAG: glycoside hydrolase family 127 protein, partial [Victivallales bacterium]|nr:glycoside hydrolase family 127 protein [Victivallales bacterium]
MDKYRDCQLKDVRLEGVPGEKMDRFLQFRVLSDFAKKDIFGEARSPIERRDDDEGMPAGGMWRGEFWGKLMLSAARVADYTQDAELLQFIKDECHRLMALQDDDGYLGSYTDKERVAFTEETGRMMDQNPAFGWHCLWNLWNRKYLIWAMLMVAKVTKDQAIMDSVIRQMDQWIDMMHRLGIPLYVTGNDQIMGVASMSVLKPLVMLYEETQNKKYLDYAA